MSSEERNHTSEISALGTIFSDTKRYSTGIHGNASATKSELYEQLFGTAARQGNMQSQDTTRRSTRGYYERYSDLSTEEVDTVLNSLVMVLAEATVIMHMPTLIEGALQKMAMQKQRD